MEFNRILFSVCPRQASRVVLVSEKKQALLESLLVFYTGITRTASDIVKEQIEKTKERKNDAFLFRMKEMVYEAEEII
jgi:galactokinase/mevalonate kinase-like predicted kinase